MTRARARAAVALLAATATPAVADRAAAADRATTADLIPLGTVEAPAVARVQVEVERSTISGEALARVHGELRVWRALSVQVGVHHRGDGTDPRPGVGAAYQLLRATRDPIGLRIQLRYRPEGLTEPEGELEASLAVARIVGDGRASAVATYGQDPEGRERDAELHVAYALELHRAVAVGATARGRRSLGAKVEGDRTWDAVAGGFATVQRDAATLQLLAGVERAGLLGGARTGAVVMAGAGAEW